MIVSIQESPLKNKRFRVTMDDGKTYDFGLKWGETYIDHKDKKKRLNYWARHCANDSERRLIDNLVPSPALFSAYLLWGDTPDIQQNIRSLNREWAKKHKI
jgi:hypothetical protein